MTRPCPKLQKWILLSAIAVFLVANLFKINEISGNENESHIEILGHPDPLLWSARHQSKFLQQVSRLEQAFPRHKRYTANTGAWALLDLPGTSYAFVHIWKSGGSSLAAQTQAHHQARKQIQKDQWVTVVRDPIDHFLSGWAECGHRRYLGALRRNQTIWSYQRPPDERVASWLSQVQKSAEDGAKSSCRMHSMPQANFLLAKGRPLPKLTRVGDLREMIPFLEALGFSWKRTLPTTRNATENDFKERNFPRDPSLLSKETLQAVCDFVALDYFLFDFEPPSVCRDQLQS